jgi:hypothetical protein
MMYGAHRNFLIQTLPELSHGHVDAVSASPLLIRASAII